MNTELEKNELKIDLYKLINLYEEIKNLKLILKEKNKLNKKNNEELHYCLSSYEIDYYSTVFREFGNADGLTSSQIKETEENIINIFKKEFDNLLIKKISTERYFKRFKLELKNKYGEKFSDLEKEFDFYRNITNNENYQKIKKNDVIIKIGNKLKKEVYNIYTADTRSIAFNSFISKVNNITFIENLYKNKTEYDSAFLSFNLLVDFLEKIKNFDFENYEEKEIGLKIIKEKIKKLLKLKNDFEFSINN